MLFIQTDRRGIRLFHTDFNVVETALCAQFVQNELQGRGAVSPSLIPPVDHELLQVVAQGFVGELPDKGEADNDAVVLDDKDTSAAVTVYVTPRQNADRRRQKAFLILTDRQGGRLEPVFLRHFRKPDHILLLCLILIYCSADEPTIVRIGIRFPKILQIKGSGSCTPENQLLGMCSHKGNAACGLRGEQTLRVWKRINAHSAA